VSTDSPGAPEPDARHSTQRGHEDDEVDLLIHALRVGDDTAREAALKRLAGRESAHGPGWLDTVAQRREDHRRLVERFVDHLDGIPALANCSGESYFGAAVESEVMVAQMDKSPDRVEKPLILAVAAHSDASVSTDILAKILQPSNNMERAPSDRKRRSAVILANLGPVFDAIRTSLLARSEGNGFSNSFPLVTFILKQIRKEAPDLPDRWLDKEKDLLRSAAFHSPAELWQIHSSSWLRGEIMFNPRYEDVLKNQEVQTRLVECATKDAQKMRADIRRTGKELHEKFRNSNYCIKDLPETIEPTPLDRFRDWRVCTPATRAIILQRQLEIFQTVLTEAAISRDRDIVYRKGFCVFVDWLLKQGHLRHQIRIDEGLKRARDGLFTTAGPYIAGRARSASTGQKWDDEWTYIRLKLLKAALEFLG
jgi:hypothetical protein